MIEIVILFILSKYDATIYRLIKVADEFFFAYLKASAGTVSPALKRLEKLGCVEYEEKMSDGGMLSKTYSITKIGRQHLCDLLISINPQNPYHLLNEIKIALYCCEVLNSSDLAEFNKNILNLLELYKIKLENGLKNEYIELNKIQTTSVEIMLDETNKLIELIR